MMVAQKKAVILLSGGLDSATCLGLAKQAGYDCYALSFDYGQCHPVELEASARVAKDLGVVTHEIVRLPIGQLLRSALTHADIAVPDHTEHRAIPVTYVPARNTIFLSIALAWAESLGARAIFIGVNAVDYSGYPDCKPDFLNAFRRVMVQATKVGVEGQPIALLCPLLTLSKADIIRKGLDAGVNYALTISCYQANAKGEPCGRCESCVQRARGFKEAGLDDRARM